MNFAYLPYLAVRVVDVTPKSNGYIPGLIFMDLTNVTPESGPYCQYDSPVAAPEFQTASNELLVVIFSLAVALVFLRVHKPRRFPESDGSAERSAYHATKHYSTRQLRTTN